MATETDLIITDLQAEIKNDLGEYGDRFTEYEGHQYICDVITEIADNNVDIYYYNLFEWVKNNWEWVDEACSEFGMPDCKDSNIIIKLIQQGQFMCNERDLYDNLDSSILNYCLDYINRALDHETITQSQYEELQEKCTNVDNNDTLEDFEDFCKKLFEEAEEKA